MMRCNTFYPREDTITAKIIYFGYVLSYDLLIEICAHFKMQLPTKSVLLDCMNEEKEERELSSKFYSRSQSSRNRNPVS